LLLPMARSVRLMAATITIGILGVLTIYSHYDIGLTRCLLRRIRLSRIMHRHSYIIIFYICFYLTLILKKV
jgi:hypothetical protein